MIAAGIAAAAAATAVAWIATPFVVMNRRGTLVEQQRAAMRLAAPAPIAVIPAPRRTPESTRRPVAAA